MALGEPRRSPLRALTVQPAEQHRNCPRVMAQSVARPRDHAELRRSVRIRQHDQTLFVHDRRGVHTLTAIPYLTYISAAAEASGELRTPMMGMIRKVNVEFAVDLFRAGRAAGCRRPSRKMCPAA